MFGTKRKHIFAESTFDAEREEPEQPPRDRSRVRGGVRSDARSDARLVGQFRQMPSQFSGEPVDAVVAHGEPPRLFPEGAPPGWVSEQRAQRTGERTRIPRWDGDRG